MRYCVIGAGAMGSLYGGRLSRAGHDVTLLDTWANHVTAINESGLILETPDATWTVPVHAADGPRGVGPVDVAIVFVDANSTASAADAAAAVLAPDGFALTLQNGIGNVETLTAVLGRERVLAGLSYHSAAVRGPGHVAQTHVGPTWMGECDGADSARLKALHDEFEAAGLKPVVVADIVAFIWDKWILKQRDQSRFSNHRPAPGRDSAHARGRRLPDTDHRRDSGRRGGQGHRVARSGNQGSDQGAVLEEVQQAVDAAAYRSG